MALPTKQKQQEASDKSISMNKRNMKRLRRECSKQCWVKRKQDQQQQQLVRQNCNETGCKPGRKALKLILLNFSKFSLLLLALLVISCCCCCCSYAMDYSSRMSNCDDIRNGFDSHLHRNNTAPRQLLNNSNSQTLFTSMQSDKQDMRLVATTTQMPDTFTAATGASMATVSGWKCCCWNDTSQDVLECRCEGEALTRVPQNLSVPMQRLTIATAGLPRLRSTGLKVYANSLQDVVLTDLKYLECIQDEAFASLKLLRTIYISHAPQLTFLSKDVFRGISDTIKIIRIINTGLMRIPDLIHLPPQNILQMIDLDGNHITRIDTKSMKIKTDLFILANNDITYIDDSAFLGSQIGKLILKQNYDLQEVHPNAFYGLSMQQLDLSSTSLIRLPSVGLHDIEELRIENTHTLKTIPSIYNFKNLQRAYLTHSFHCCAFKFPSRHDPRRHSERMKEIGEWQRQCIKNQNSNHNKHQSSSSGSGSGSGSSSGESVGSKYGAEFFLATTNRINAGDGVVYSRLQRNLPSIHSEKNQTTDKDYTTEKDMVEMNNDYEADEIGVFHDQITIDPEESQLDEYCGNFTFRKHDIECYPVPNALNPCEDVMGYKWLRISVWIVVALAVVGNVAVLVVLLSIKSESASVPRFLMSHLAFADLCLGLYLLLIAAIDAHSMGEYFNYAYDWQYGIGCKVAGFLTVFASHLSVFTLTVITIERWFAITHALYLNKRIKLRPAAYIMICGWIYSVVMSLLPLFGISNYSSTSICLPMEIRDPFDVAYLVSIMGSNGLAFTIIAICYAQIYLSLGHETRHARHTHPGEMTIAKKMALLVFTNFTCWAPIAFFGLTALAGYPLINVTKSKILLVFFYPLNSCADPYLYAILTSQYRQDLYTLLAKFGLCKQNALKYKHSFSLPYATNYTTAQGSSIHRNNSLSPKTHQSGKSVENILMLKSREDFV